MQAQPLAEPVNWNIERKSMSAGKKRGLLIVLEGIDGAGKTTQAYLLVDKLRKLGYPAEYTCEPTYGRLGDILRLHVSKMKPRAPIYEALLYAADRYEHFKKTIEPRLKRVRILVSDRYLYSSLAYQGAAGVDLKWLGAVNFFVPKPDLTFYIDIPPKGGLKRKTGVRTVYEEPAFEQKVRRLYLQLANREGFITLDGRRSIPRLQREIVSTVLKYLKSRRLVPTYFE